MSNPSNTIGSPEWLAQISVFEAKIHENEKAFLAKFTKSNHCWMLTTLSVSSERVYFVWIEDEGQHLFGDAPIQDVVTWVKTLP